MSKSGWQPLSSPTKPLPAGQAVIVLDPADSVGTVVRDLQSGEMFAAGLVSTAAVPKGHKIARVPVAAGDVVRKYAQVIGYAKENIAIGDHVHVHNLEFRNTDPDYRIGKDCRPTELIPSEKRAVFSGFRRPDGKVGTRSYLGIISTVNCSATAARRIAAHFTPARLAGYPQVDGVAAFIHGTGCGMAGAGAGMDNLQRVMQGYAANPNMAGVLILGLGCEMNQVDALLQRDGINRGPMLKTMNIQSVGGLTKSVSMGIKAIEKMLPIANEQQRETCMASELTLALQCGGSDGWSGITANPALGHAADMLVAHGGTAVLAETPEIYGAEHLLTSRAIDPSVAQALIERIKWWEGYVARNDGSMDNNPSPGNKRGGLTTILEKSLGAVAKGGTTSLNGVYHYAEPISARGFTMMDSPGYDPVSVTGQIASGCNLVAFTTGRGSTFGSKPVPTLKICTNSDTFRHMPDDMDVDAGQIVSQGMAVEEIGKQIFARLLSLASGEKSKSEMQGLGDHEFVPWQIGATM